MATLLTNPAVIYAGCTFLLFSSYLGIEMSQKKLGDSGTKSVISLWSSISLIILLIIAGIHSSQEVGIASSQSVVVMYVLCVLTISISSIILKSAWS